MLSQYPQSAFGGFTGRVGAEAAVCDPNPPRLFDRYRWIASQLNSTKPRQKSKRSWLKTTESQLKSTKWRFPFRDYHAVSPDDISPFYFQGFFFVFFCLVDFNK